MFLKIGGEWFMKKKYLHYLVKYLYLFPLYEANLLEIQVVWEGQGRTLLFAILYIHESLGVYF